MTSDFWPGSDRLKRDPTSDKPSDIRLVVLPFQVGALFKYIVPSADFMKSILRNYTHAAINLQHHIFGSMT